MEPLTAYIRKNSPVENENIIVEDMNNQNKISLDIQAILRVITRQKYCVKHREQTSKYEEDFGLDLYRTDILELNLKELISAVLTLTRLTLER